MLIRELLRRALAPEGGEGAGGAAAGGGGGQAAAGAGAAGDGKPSGEGEKGGEGSAFSDLNAGTGGEGKGAQGGGDKGSLTPEQQAIAAAEKDVRRPVHVPSKYWDAEKGEVRAEAAFKSLAELEGRMKEIGLPPKDVSEYKVEIPDALKEVGIDLSERETKAFQALAHSLGLTQKQYQGVMGAYFQSIEQMGLSSLNYGKARLLGELKGELKTDEAVSGLLKDAFKAVNAYGTPAEIEAALGAKGNVPPWAMKVLAKVGKELGEDPGVNPDTVLAGDSLAHLMRGKPGDEDAPYWNPKDPRHTATKQKVMAYHQAQAASRQRKAA